MSLGRGQYSLDWTGKSLILPDGSTWTATGFSDTATYTTSSTGAFVLTPTWVFSSTANGIAPISISPVMTPTGASAGNISGILMMTTANTSAVNISTLRGANIGVNIGAAYTGTIASGVGFQVSAPGLAGTNPFTSYAGISVATTANGNGITSGTVTNTGVTSSANTAAAGVGGTVTNTNFLANLATASAAGTTNYGFRVSGNGGAASTNWALYSDSTAPSLISGGMVNPPRVVVAAGAVTIAITDFIVIVNKTVGAATAANLPASPTTGARFKIKDGKGDAAANNITVTPAAGTIDGAATYVMATNYQAAELVYNGTEWNVL